MTIAQERLVNIARTLPEDEAGAVLRFIKKMKQQNHSEAKSIEGSVRKKAFRDLERSLDRFYRRNPRAKSVMEGVDGYKSV